MLSLFKPSVAIRNPARYLLALFFLFFGGFNVADAFRLLIGDKQHTDLSVLLTLTLLCTVSVFVTQFQRQRKQQAV